MKKVPPRQPPSPAGVATSVITLRKMARRIRPTSVERDIIDHILFDGRDLRWTLYTGTNMLAVIGCLIERPINGVSVGMISLEKRGWVKRDINDVGQHYVQLTRRFVVTCMVAQRRWEVRRALGPTTWEKINGNGQLADKLHRMSQDMKHAKYKDRVKAAVSVFLETGNAIPDTRESNSRKPGLRLIVGERKYDA